MQFNPLALPVHAQYAAVCVSTHFICLAERIKPPLFVCLSLANAKLQGTASVSDVFVASVNAVQGNKQVRLPCSTNQGGNHSPDASRTALQTIVKEQS